MNLKELKVLSGLSAVKQAGIRTKQKTFGASQKKNLRGIGEIGLEPTTSCTQSRHATKLRHSPKI
jgi:hypothetical protein